MEQFTSLRPVAHIVQTDQEWKTHDLYHHLESVSKLCSEFAERLTSDKRFGSLGAIIGRWHDVGKYHPQFQNYIKHTSGYDPEIKSSQKTPHSAVGALFATDLFKNHGKSPAGIQRIFEYCISSHHRGLYDINPLRNRLESIEEITRYKSSLNTTEKQFLQEMIDQDSKFMLTNPLDKTSNSHKNRQLILRMLFSCLVDADFLDTEAFMDPDRNKLRCMISTPDFRHLRDLLKRKTDAFDREGEINHMRNKFLEQCRTSGKVSERGYYSLFLPTGAGKTLSSMTWALENAIYNHADRIIYVIPYTSIISQTAATFRDIFGDNNVLEHHSDIDIEDEEVYKRSKLLSENWDAPIIVTTTVQFFESLFANRPSKCRKLHNIANAIVVFDEVQMFPMSYLNPILRTIDGLVDEFQTQVLFCTATLPLMDEMPKDNGMCDARFYPLQAAEIHPLVPYNKEEFDVFRRADFNLIPKEHTIDSLSEEICACNKAVLCVVNTRSDAKKLYDAIVAKSEGNVTIIHLSRMMCSAHIKIVLTDLKERLKNCEQVKVISTQLIEAGVDIDFPIVYRAESSLISIIQAGGRCNREGRLHENGVVNVFKLSDGKKTLGEMIQGTYATSDMISKYAQGIDLNNPEIINEFYRHLYGRTCFDEKKIEKDLWDLNKYQNFYFNFECAATKFKMIENTGEQEILVPYMGGAEVIDELRNRKILNRHMYRKMQQYMVRVNLSDFEKLKKSRSIECIQIGKTDIVYVLNHIGCYHKYSGVLLDNPNNETTIII
ncbi:CRISPR-associated helicase Cas3' [Porphyromonas pogonae]|uniref:CRISPR-associated helicase Cas3' n=1 Tax=Porphyromonas pogonae TaxID=867595 RepID=UPI002E765E3B|nr:CRISPR-associated helicase Cas3' [Porphyromonas pogonae]